MGIMRFAAVLCLALLVGCSSSEFKPQAGLFSGAFSDGTSQLGIFSLTVTDGLVGGTGTLLHNGNMANVTISAVISGKSISGQVTNSALGAGEFVGSFTREDRAVGTFKFMGAVDQVLTTGSWEAEIQ